MQFLRNLADHGQAILCTIHQPSAELFQVFDRLLLLRKGGETVYFGDIGQHARTMIGYFERHGSRPCSPDENPAEFMLDVIGAGATATATQDWYDVWSKSSEAERLQQEIARVYEEGRQRGVVETSRKSEYATTWGYQVLQLIQRDAYDHWRDPTYLFAKLILNIVGGLFIGFTFFQAVDTQQGTQNKVFALFMASILSVPLVGQIQVPFLNTRNVYEIRERPSRMYSWTALLTAQIAAEVPWNILGSGIFFLCWYWTVGFDNSRAGYTYLMLGLVFPFYYTTIGFAVAAMAPNAEIANILFSLIFSFVLTLYVPFFCLYILPMLTTPQRRCRPALLAARLVEVDVPPLAVHLLHRGSPWSGRRPRRRHLRRHRVRHPDPALWPVVRRLPLAVHLHGGRIPHQPGCDVGLPVLLGEDDGPVPRAVVQHLLLEPLARLRHHGRVHGVQRESSFIPRLSNIV